MLLLKERGIKWSRKNLGVSSTSQSSKQQDLIQPRKSLVTSWEPTPRVAEDKNESSLLLRGKNEAMLQ